MSDEDAKALLIGKTIESIKFNPEYDDGVIIILADGTEISIGFYSFEGSIFINKQQWI